MEQETQQQTIRTIAETRAEKIKQLEEDNAAQKATIKEYLLKIAELNKQLYEANTSITELKKVSQADELSIENTEESQATSFFKTVETYLNTHGEGPQSILHQIERRNSIERARYIASLDQVTDALQINADNMRDLAQRSRIAQGLVEG